MKANPWYQTILFNYQHLQDLKLSDNITILYKRNKEQKSYYCLKMDMEYAKIGDFLLQELHLSVYEYVSTKNAFLGPCHITSEWLHTTNSKRYRLHVYLDKQDLIRTQYRWDLCLPDGRYEEQSQSPLIDALINYSWQLSLPCLSRLRALQQRTKIELENIYQHNDIFDEKENDIDNTNLLSLLSKQEFLATKLYDITGISKWQRLQSYCRATKKYHSQNLASSSSSSSSTSAWSLSSKEKASLITYADLSENDLDMPNILSPQLLSLDSKDKDQDEYHSPLRSNSLYNKKQIRPDALEQLKKLKDNISRQYKELQELKAQNAQAPVVLLNSLYDNLAMCYLDDNYSFNSTFILKCKKAETILEEMAKKCLQNNLLRQNVDVIKQLSRFNELLDIEAIAKMSLMLKGTKLLEILITDFKFPFNTSPVTINAKTYANAVVYCSEKQQSKHLSILIKAGANIMQSQTPGGSPIAYEILNTTPKHPLYQALEDNKDITLENPVFYRTLCAVLTGYKTTLPLEQQCSIDESISLFQSHANTYDFNNRHFNSKAKEAYRELASTAKETIGEDIIQQLMKDKELGAKRAQLEALAKIMIESMKRLYKKKGLALPLNCCMQNYFKEMNSIIENYGNLLHGMCIKDMKISLLKHLNLYERYLKTARDFADNALALINMPGFFGQKNKKQKKLMAMDKKLRSELQQLENSLQPSSTGGLSLLGSLSKILAGNLQNLGSSGIHHEITSMLSQLDALLKSPNFEEISQRLEDSNFYERCQLLEDSLPKPSRNEQPDDGSVYIEEIKKTCSEF